MQWQSSIFHFHYKEVIQIAIINHIPGKTTLRGLRCERVDVVDREPVDHVLIDRCGKGNRDILDHCTKDDWRWSAVDESLSLLSWTPGCNVESREPTRYELLNTS